MISLKLPNLLLDRLKEEARVRRTSRSRIIRESLEKTLLAAKSGKRSCHDLAAHLAGSMKGPKDIATNPRYMEDYGK